MKRILNPASTPINGTLRPIFIAITFTAGKLAISGVEGPHKSGNAYGSCGQINMGMDDAYISKLTYTPGWSPTQFRRLLAIWDRWHLNDMQAGSPAQMAHLRTLTRPTKPFDHYTWACQALAEVGLHPDPDCIINGQPYKYGHSWLAEEVPASILEELSAFPESTLTPEWV